VKDKTVFVLPKKENRIKKVFINSFVEYKKKQKTGLLYYSIFVCRFSEFYNKRQTKGIFISFIIKKNN
jgi:hypothetical protein